MNYIETKLSVKKNHTFSDFANFEKDKIKVNLVSNWVIIPSDELKKLRNPAYEYLVP
jgi:hypothetical protein